MRGQECPLWVPLPCILCIPWFVQCPRITEDGWDSRPYLVTFKHRTLLASGYRLRVEFDCTVNEVDGRENLIVVTINDVSSCVNCRDTPVNVVDTTVNGLCGTVKAVCPTVNMPDSRVNRSSGFG